ARLRTLWTRQYPIEHACLGLAGDVDLDAVVARIEAMLPRTPSEAGPAVVDKAPRYPQRPVTRLPARAYERPQRALALPALVVSGARVYALDGLRTPRARPVARLFAAPPARQGPAYPAWVSSMEGTGAGPRAVYAASSRNKAERALA